MKKFNRDFTHKEVETLCKEYNRNIKDFYKFMRGQTMSLDKNEEPVYFGRDIGRFFVPTNVSITDIYRHIAMEK